MTIARSLWENLTEFEFDSHAVCNVFNDGKGDFSGKWKSPDGLGNLQLHQQCHLRRACSHNTGRPLALVETWTEELLQIAWGERIR